MLVQTRKRCTAVGVDLGETALRAAQLRCAGDLWQVVATAHVVRTPGDAATARPPELELKRLLAAAPFKGKSVIAALNPPEVEFHVLDIPKAAMQDGANAGQIIHWEIGRLTSLSTDQIETRHWLLPSRLGATSSVIGVSVTREAVLRMLRLCGESGLSCTSVDTGATAIHRFGSMLRRWPQDEVWGLLDLGARQGRLVLSLGDVPILIRHVGGGGQSWTERIAENLQISTSAAEIQKHAHGIALMAQREDCRNPDPALHDEVAIMLLSALRGELNEMASEIKRSYEYVLGSYPGRRAGDLVLVGGGAAMPNLPEFLSRILGIAVRPASQYLSTPGCRLQLDATCKERLESFALAIGLAVGDETR